MFVAALLWQRRWHRAPLSCDLSCQPWLLPLLTPGSCQPLNAWFSSSAHPRRENVNPSPLAALCWTPSFTRAFHYGMKSSCLLERHQLVLSAPAASRQFISQSLEKLERAEAMERNMNISKPDFLCWKRLHDPQRHVTQGKGSEHICDWNKPQEVQSALSFASSV